MDSKYNVKMIYKLSLFVVFIMFCQSNIQSQNNYWKEVNHSFDSIVAIIEDSPTKNIKLDSLLPLLQSVASSSNDPVVQCRYLYWDCVHRIITNDNSKSALESLQKAIHLIDTAVYQYDYARMQFMLINPTENRESYIDQYKAYFKLLTIFEDVGDIKYQANVNRNLGILLRDLEEYQEALKYLYTANELYEQIGAQELIISNMINISVIYSSLNNPKKAIGILNSILKEKHFHLDTNVLMTIYTNLYSSETDTAIANIYSEKVYELSKLYPKSQYQINIANILMGETYLDRGHLDSALSCFNRANTYAVKNKSSRILIPALLNISRTFAKQNKWEDAYKCKTNYIQARDSIKASNNKSELYRIQVSAAIKEYESQLIIEHQKSVLRKKQFIIVLLIGLGLILGVLSVLVYIWQKKKLTEESLQKKELLNKNLQLEIDLQNRELSATVLVLSEKNGILSNLLAQMEKFRSNGEMSNSCEYGLRKLITDNLHSENEWDSFKLHFEKVHPVFFQKLNEMYPSLTTNYLKLCAYIRIGMTTKQISQMTSVLPNTVKTNRYFLRKKFELQKMDSLDDFIRNV